MSDQWVNIRGVLVPFQMDEAEAYGFRPKRVDQWSAPLEAPTVHYKKKCADVGPRMLRDASLNSAGFVEAGYCLGSDEGDGTAWFISKSKAPG